MSESCATCAFEPCQVLTEAALRNVAGVPRGCLEGATCRISANGDLIEKRVRDLLFPPIFHILHYELLQTLQRA
jgi:hypothetical protein